MFQLADGRQHVYQWDINVKLLLDESNESADEVHFSARFSRVSLSVEVVHTVDSSYVTIPNILLQKPNDIIAYSYITNADGSYTKYDTIIPVIARPKPSGYIYEETEILTWKTLDDKIDDLGRSTADAVKYTEQVLTDEQKTRARTNIGAVSADELPEQVQADWLQNTNAAPDFVKNRTHYEEVALTEIIPETTVMIAEGGYAAFQIDKQLVAGETYSVTLNGIKYECVARYGITGSGLDYVIIGNGEPFSFVSYTNYQDLNELYVATGGEYTFSMSHKVTVAHKIAEKYMPVVQTDWLQFDGSAADYLKNKPFGYDLRTADDYRITQYVTSSGDKLNTVRFSNYGFSHRYVFMIRDDIYTNLVANETSGGNYVFGDIEQNGISVHCELFYNKFYIISIEPSDKYTDLELSEIKVYDLYGTKKISEDFLPDLPLASYKKNGIFTADAIDSSYSNFSNLERVFFNVDDNSKLYSQKSVAFFEQLDFIAINSSRENKIGIAKAVGDAGEVLGLTDDDAPFMFYPCRYYIEYYPTYEYFIQSASGRKFKATKSSNYTQGFTTFTEIGNQSGGCLTVTEEKDPDGNTFASHSSSEIYEAFQSGKTVQLYYNKYLYQLGFCSNDMAGFSFIITGGGETRTESIAINAKKNIISMTDGNWNTLYPVDYVLNSSTEGSTKRFRITVDDSGTLSATEVTN